MWVTCWILQPSTGRYPRPARKYGDALLRQGAGWRVSHGPVQLLRQQPRWHLELVEGDAQERGSSPGVLIDLCHLRGAWGGSDRKTTQGANKSLQGQQKWMCERLLADAVAAYELDSVALRYFNAAGASHGGIGESHDPKRT